MTDRPAIANTAVLRDEGELRSQAVLAQRATESGLKTPKMFVSITA